MKSTEFQQDELLRGHQVQVFRKRKTKHHHMCTHIQPCIYCYIYIVDTTGGKNNIDLFFSNIIIVNSLFLVESSVNVTFLESQVNYAACFFQILNTLCACTTRYFQEEFSAFIYFLPLNKFMEHIVKIAFFSIIRSYLKLTPS